VRVKPAGEARVGDALLGLDVADAHRTRGLSLSLSLSPSLSLTLSLSLSLTLTKTHIALESYRLARAERPELPQVG
jgi:hypothetical protein